MAELVRTVVIFGSMALLCGYFVRQCRKPAGWLGRAVARDMNRRHAGLTSWGLGHVTVQRNDRVLDVGCGGGQTLARLASLAPDGTVNGVDYSEASIAAAKETNRSEIESGRVRIQLASVSQLPFPGESFDLVTAIETHYYWPSVTEDLRELRRVLKPGGRVLLVAEAYRGGLWGVLQHGALKLIGGTCYSIEEHRRFFEEAGYANPIVEVVRSKGWICATAINSCKDSQG